MTDPRMPDKPAELLAAVARLELVPNDRYGKCDERDAPPSTAPPEVHCSAQAPNVYRRGACAEVGGFQPARLRAYSARRPQLAARQVISPQARWSMAR